MLSVLESVLRNKNSNFSINSNTVSFIFQCKFKKHILNIQGLITLPKKHLSKTQKFSQSHRSFAGFEPKWPQRLFSSDCSFGSSASGNQAPAIAAIFSKTIRDMMVWLKYKFLFPMQGIASLKIIFHLLPMADQPFLCKPPSSVH